MDWLLSQLGKQRANALRKYKAFVAGGIGQASPWSHVRGQMLLGSERFVKRLQPQLEDKRALKEIPRKQRFSNRPALARIFCGRTLPSATDAMRPSSQPIWSTATAYPRSVVQWICIIRRSAAS